MTTIQEIAKMRAEVDAANELVRDQQKLINDLPEFQKLEGLINKRIEVQGSLNALEKEYRDACVTAYNETQEKKYPGGQIKIYTRLDYKDFDARQWSMEHNHVGLLKLDKRAFERVAKEIKPDFVEFSEDPKMTLASDLSEFLE